ncbi:MAG: hypothetical protein HY537_05135 [Deltaproteobacteria bacterium]|nr:hypothetical protein [Deltaproteobacteria bacterium]
MKGLIVAIVCTIAFTGQVSFANSEAEWEDLIPADQLAEELGQEGITTERDEGANRLYPIPMPFPRPYPYPAPLLRCFASNLQGQMFHAHGYDVYLTQRLALNRCYRQSRVCISRGCRYY